MSRNSLLETDMISEVLSCCNRTRTNNHLVCEWKLNDLAKLDCLARLTKWLSVYLQTKWLWAQVPLQPPTILSLLVSLFFRKILIPFMSFFEAFLFFWIILSWRLWHKRKKFTKNYFIRSKNAATFIHFVIIYIIHKILYFCSLYKWLNHNTFINYLKDNIFRHFFKGL